MHPRRPHPSSPDSFTLIELLAVMAIISIIAAVTIPAISTMQNSMKLTTAGELLTDQLTFARQAAMTRDCEVEFRFYELPDGQPSNTSTSPTTYRAVQGFSLDADGSQTNALTRVAFLPQGIVIDSASSLSSLLPSTPSNPPYAVSGSTQTAPVGAYAPSSYNYIDFHFKPDGSTDLNPNAVSPWFVTLVNEVDLQRAGNNAPANFYTLEVDPLTGHVRSFRPH
jgi:uncharacterized protein (TIGR02596 family)